MTDWWQQQQPQADQSRVADSLIVPIELKLDPLHLLLLLLVVISCPMTDCFTTFNNPIHALPFENCSFCRLLSFGALALPLKAPCHHHWSCHSKITHFFSSILGHF